MTAAPYRVLVTGSRTWADEQAVHDALNEAYTRTPRRPFVVVHGACPGGADAYARSWAVAARATCPVGEEAHPADWRRHGRAAGPIRNAAMVQQGADLCLAFIRAGSRGAMNCADLAGRAGIPVRRWLA